MVEQPVEPVSIAVAQQLDQESRIDVTRARAHHQAFERRHPHAGLDAATVLDGGDARAIAEMARDDPKRLRRSWRVAPRPVSSRARGSRRGSHTGGRRSRCGWLRATRTRAPAWARCRGTRYRRPPRAGRRETTLALVAVPRARADCAGAPGGRGFGVPPSFARRRVSRLESARRHERSGARLQPGARSPLSRLRTSRSSAEVAVPMSRQSSGARSTRSSRRTGAGPPMPVTRRSSSRAPLALSISALLIEELPQLMARIRIESGPHADLSHDRNLAILPVLSPVATFACLAKRLPAHPFESLRVARRTPRGPK